MTLNSLRENFKWAWLQHGLCTIAFQELSDSAHGDLSSGIKTSLFSLKTSCGKFGENSRLNIATVTIS